MAPRAPTAALLALVASCAAPPPALVQLDPPRPAPPAPTPAASVAVAEPSIFEGHERHRVAFVIHPGEPPCTFVFDGKQHEESAGVFAVYHISRLAIEASPVCAAQVLYDFAHLRREPGVEPLDGGEIAKSGHRLPRTDGGAEYEANQITDFDFDGYADICITELHGGTIDYVPMCWLFHPKTRSFVRSSELERTRCIEVDREKQTLRTTRRAWGEVFQSGESRWKAGKLEPIWEELIAPTKLDTSPLPVGYKRWRQRKELRGGKMVVVFDGPEKVDP